MEALKKTNEVYLQFRQKLENNINNSPNINPSEDCCLKVN